MVAVLAVMVVVIAIAVVVMMLAVAMMMRGAAVMRRRLVMLPQQVEAVVVAVRRAHDGVDVELGRLRVGQEHAGVVVELDEGHRALHPVIERAVLAEAADPAEMRVRQMPLDLGDARLARARPAARRDTSRPGPSGRAAAAADSASPFSPS